MPTPRNATLHRNENTLDENRSIGERDPTPKDHHTMGPKGETEPNAPRAERIPDTLELVQTRRQIKEQQPSPWIVIGDTPRRVALVYRVYD